MNKLKVKVNDFPQYERTTGKFKGLACDPATFYY
jgi:hypothetical protein